MWAFGARAGFYAGLCISTCFGLFLFTRILVPDVMLTASIALSMWAFLRAIDEDGATTRDWWAFVMAASLGTSLLFKSLIGVVFPIGAALIYLAVTRQLFSRKSLEGPASVERPARCAADRRSLAHSRDAPQSAVFRLHDAQRAGRISRLLLVLLH